MWSGLKDRRTDGRTDGQIDRRTDDGHFYNPHPLRGGGLTNLQNYCVVILYVCKAVLVHLL